VYHRIVENIRHSLYFNFHKPMKSSNSNHRKNENFKTPTARPSFPIATLKTPRDPCANHQNQSQPSIDIQTQRPRSPHSQNFKLPSIKPTSRLPRYYQTIQFSPTSRFKTLLPTFSLLVFPYQWREPSKPLGNPPVERPRGSSSPPRPPGSRPRPPAE